MKNHLKESSWQTKIENNLENILEIDCNLSDESADENCHKPPKQKQIKQNKKLRISREKSKSFKVKKDSKSDKLPEITNQYDLYSKAPSVNYIKEKYDVYSNWLSKNKKKPLNGAQESKNDQQLNWYEFQKSVYVNENDCFRFLKRPLPVDALTKSDSKNTSTLNGVVSPPVQLKNSKYSHSTMSCYQTDLESEKPIKRSSSIELSSSRLPTIDMKSSLTLIKVKNAFLKEIKRTEDSTKGVQFSNPMSTTEIFQDNAHQTQTRNKILPPINVKCSDDFYAVLTDINNEESILK